MLEAFMSDWRETLNLLEWPALAQEIADRCYTPYAQKMWLDTPFLPTEEAVTQHLLQVDALMGILTRYGEPLLDQPIGDSLPALLRVHKGGILSVSDLKNLLVNLKGAYSITSHLGRYWEKDDVSKKETLLAPLFDQRVPDEEGNPTEVRYTPKPVIQHLETLVSTKQDGLLDSASPRLYGLKQRLGQQKNALKDKMQSYIANPNYAQALQSPVMTERDGRAVLPVKIEFKTTVPGVIHAGSSSGSTLFVEPQGAIELNNAIHKTMGEIEGEILEILQTVSKQLQTQAQDLITYLKRLGEIDRRLAGARLSIRLNATPPKVILSEPGFHLRQCRHPLLILQKKSQGESLSAVVANDMILGVEGQEHADVKTLIITGPNTGGKTVLLKTLGLCVLMAQAGLPIPCDEGSSLFLFSPILVDIGDQQSLSENLSTFSGHLTRLKSFIAPETPLNKALVLIDEIGSGTDPAEGSALARAILEHLYDRGAFTIVTTHLGELKLEAHNHPGYLNASMIFDPEALQPTYQIRLGIPGTSNALMIAERLGVQTEVIQRAKAHLSQPNRESSTLIQELEQKNRQAEEALKLAESYKLSAEEQHRKMELERQQFHEERRRILNQFKASLKARLIPLEDQLKDLQSLFNSQDLREVKAMRGVPNKISRLGDKADAILGKATDELEASEEEDSLSMDDLTVGETVKSRRLSLSGIILEKKKASNEVVLEAGNIKVSVPLADVEKLYQPQKKKKAKPKDLSKVIASLPMASEARLECDVRGMRVEDALLEVDRFLDQAILAGYERLGIIHGLGTGALKNAVRQHLRAYPVVKKYYPEEAQFGGDGKTIIEF
jgi:DNA mismatch repair protein MutS2